MAPASAKKYNFKKQTVLITGGGSGIGKAAALAFAKAGATAVIAGRNMEKLKIAAREISKSGLCDYGRIDVENPAAAKSLVVKLIKKFGKIDVLVNCAGVYGPIGLFHTNELEQWHEALKINLLGTVNMIHAVLPSMVRRKKGKIINLSGGGAVQPFPNFSAYGTSKAAVVRFTENLAKEYEPFNIQVNAIAPGAINSSFLDQVLNAGKRAGKVFYLKSLEQKKTGGDSPELAAELMLFLCSPGCELSGKLVSAKWDPWAKLTERDISTIQKKSTFTLRRIDNKYFQEL